ncbi:MAG: hypothetical protein H0V53_13610 [Rubrobacter sp.]|nr:hypothetical protein [Rubrobacter sp.]
MEYIRGILDELEEIVADASRIPLRRGQVMVDRSDLLVMLGELRGSLPGELAEAEALRREYESIVAAGEEEGNRILREARERAEAQARETQAYQRSQRRCSENVERAERYAEEVSRGSEAYRDEVMGQLEGWLRDSLGSIAGSRQELEETSRRPSPVQPVEEDEGETWRASSA